jgi:internalin A
MFLAQLVKSLTSQDVLALILTSQDVCDMVLSYVEHLEFRGVPWILDGLQNIKTLSWTDTDYDFEQVAQLTTLTSLRFRSERATFASISTLSTMTRLKSLYIQDIELYHLNGLSNLVGLTSLAIDMRLDEDTMGYMNHLSNLRELSLLGLEANTGIQTGALEHITKWTNLGALTKLDLRFNPLEFSDVIPAIASALPQLKDLDLSNTDVTETYYDKLSNLTRLVLDNTNVEMICGLPAELQVLHANSSALDEIDFLPPTLRELSIEKCLNRRSGITFNIDWPTMTQLTFINASQSLVDFNGIPPALKSLNFSKFDRFSVISCIEGMTTLEELDLSSSEVSDVSVLRGLTNLRRLDLHDNDIVNVKPLSALTKLTWLDLCRNPRLNNIACLSALKDHCDVWTGPR